MDNMNNQNKFDEQPERRRFSLRGLFYNNTFVLLFSLVCSVLAWFFVTTADTTSQSTRTIADVPVEIELSDEAVSDRLKVFSLTHDTADVTVTGSSLVINKLTNSDLRVIGTYWPDSTKVSSTGLRKETVELKAQKAGGELMDYNITAISPEEITIEVDRVLEITLPIETEISFTSESGYSAGEPILSDTSLTISGPESAVNRISRVVATYEFDAPLNNEQRFSAGLKLYDQDGMEIKDSESQHISLNIDRVEVVIPVLIKKTVQLAANVINAPQGFADNRVHITPGTIDIAGTEEDLAGIETITLSEAIDFSEVTASNFTFERAIPIPAGIRNLSTVEVAEVEIDLAGFKAASIQTPNIKVSNAPAGMNVEVITRMLTISIMGSEAQIGKLTGENIYCTLDMTGRGDLMGDVELPVSVMISGADSCWAVGKYTVNVTISEAVAVNAQLDYLSSGLSSATGAEE